MVDRLFQIVYLLMERSWMTAKELADMFEVSERTIYWDIDKLTLAGIPVYTSQGRNGGISLMPDYILNKTVLTHAEKAKIFESLNALSETSLGKSGQNGDAILKLRNFFGDKYQDWLEIDFSDWGSNKKEADTFSHLKEAILSHRYMEIVYSGNQGALIRRTVKPLKLCFKNQAWYLYAYCCLRSDYRFFKLRRISQLTALDSYFEPEAVGKVLLGNLPYGNPAAGAVPSSIPQAKPDSSQTTDSLSNLRSRHYKNAAELSAAPVTLEISPDMAFRAFDELPDISVLDNGKLRAAAWVTDLEWLISYVLSYGPYMRVIEPESIREKVKKAIEEMRKLY